MPSKRTALLAAMFVLATAGCAAPASVSTPSTTGAGPTSATTAAAATVAPATAGPVQTKPALKTATVDLTFSGTVAFVAKGTKGTCQVGKKADGSYVFGFFMSGADYPGLGDTFAINEDAGSGKVAVKWITPSGNVPFFGYMGSGVTFAADHHSVSLDAELPPSAEKTEHVKGTISCP